MSIDKFQKYLATELSIINQQECKVFFINAWNEWGEGTYLEPDTVRGYGFLEAIKEELIKINEKFD